MMRRSLFVALVLLAGTAALAPSATPARDGIRRCEGADGVTIYTDRRCEDLDALSLDSGSRPIAAPPSAEELQDLRPAKEQAPVAIRTDCARLPDTLLFDLRRAIEARDVNRLAGLYHWPGTGSRGARYVMDRLQRLVDLPAPAVDLVWPEVSPVREDPGAFPAGTPPEDPIAARISAFDAQAGDTVQELALLRHAGCWWVSFAPRRATARRAPPEPPDVPEAGPAQPSDAVGDTH